MYFNDFVFLDFIFTGHFLVISMLNDIIPHGLRRSKRQDVTQVDVTAANVSSHFVSMMPFLQFFVVSSS
jgi:hypothetical protein